MAQDKYNMKISIWGTGNAGFRIAIALKGAGFEIPFVVNRSLQSAKQLSSILNKPEYNHFNLPDTHPSVNFDEMEGSDIIIVAISDDALEMTTVASGITTKKFTEQGLQTYRITQVQSSMLKSAFVNCVLHTYRITQVQSVVV